MAASVGVRWQPLRGSAETRSLIDPSCWLTRAPRSSSTRGFLGHRLYALVRRSPAAPWAPSWYSRNWPVGWDAVKHALNAEVFIDIRPVHSLTAPDETPVRAFGRGCLRQAPGPSERHADHPSVREVGGDLVLGDAHILNMRIVASRSGHANAPGIQRRAVRLGALALRGSFGAFSKPLYTASNTASGCRSTTRSRTRALPSGLRRPCSQFRRVPTLI